MRLFAIENYAFASVPFTNCFTDTPGRQIFNCIKVIFSEGITGLLINPFSRLVKKPNDHRSMGLIVRQYFTTEQKRFAEIKKPQQFTNMSFNFLPLQRVRD